MRSPTIGTLAVALLMVSLCNAQKRVESSQRQKFPSPDGQVVAIVCSTKVPEATIESRIELRSEDGRVLAKHRYTSEDGEHGYGVTKAAWTPDSRFFVYSLESSGGHQSWHAPVQFFSRISNKFVRLDDVLRDAVSDPEFVISPPDHVTVKLWFSKQTKTVSLGHLPDWRRTVERLPHYMTATPQPIPEQIKLPDAPHTVRSVQCFRSFTSESTMTDVVKKCGIPDEHQGSGIFIFLYDMDDGSIVAVGTADLQKLLYVDHIANSGSSPLLRSAPSR